jgi:hypothetical protein
MDIELLSRYLVTLRISEHTLMPVGLEEMAIRVIEFRLELNPMQTQRVEEALENLISIMPVQTQRMEEALENLGLILSIGYELEISKDIPLRSPKIFLNSNQQPFAISDDTYYVFVFGKL